MPPQDNLEGNGWTAGIKNPNGTNSSFYYEQRKIKRKRNISPNEHVQQEDRGTQQN